MTSVDSRLWKQVGEPMALKGNRVSYRVFTHGSLTKIQRYVDEDEAGYVPIPKRLTEPIIEVLREAVKADYVVGRS